MHVLARPILLRFGMRFPDAAAPLDRWYRFAKKATWANVSAMKADFPSADVYGPLTIFNIKGNDYRLIAQIDYSRGKVYVREILTHKEYDRDAWKARWTP